MSELIKMFLVVLGALLGLVASYVAYVCWCQTYWMRKGVFALRSTFLLGSLGPAILKKTTLSDNIIDLYKEAKAKNLKCAGMYLTAVPVYYIVDVDLVKEVTVKQFDHFTDRQPFTRRSVDELFGRSLLSLKGNDWRKMRHNLSPSFTGSKLRGMTDLMVQIGIQYAKFITSRPNYDESLDMKIIFRRFALDVIATTAFGTATNTLENPKSEFYNKSSSILDFTGKRKFIAIGYTIAPKLMEILRIPFVPKDVKNFFTSVIVNNIKFREQNNKSRPDMIQLLIDERNAQIQKFKEANQPVDEASIMSDLDIVAQAFTFFLAGFETVSNLTTLVCMVLGGEKDVQEKLREEVDDAFAKSGNGKLSYDAIQGMKYLDMVISEVQRLIPVTPFGDRICNKDLDLPEYGINFKEGDIVGIPFYAFSRDPEHFPDPDEFKPERFSEENKHKIKPFTFMPFGSGPRGCIGNRFALLEVKIALAYTLAFCEIDLNTPDQYPIRLDKTKIENSPIGGFMLKIKPRENPPVVLEKN
ncbi:cytochrome P450 9e2-like isoform X2 [Neocloeon triangulifer]|uniref:cytochrome P450 9e2-like isoform X2 n=1 Tax=Neocloeon triangulifer TaxID=2078957 RepID=UPI00286EC063|nr:cytochrome P450 9e2-like isoform X2 [Neocloeon triangulifer]